MDVERRSYRRFRLQMPVKVAAGGAGPSIDTATHDISADGVYFTLPAEPSLQHELEWDMEMPGGLPLGSTVRVHCIGRIVRIERAEPGRVGVAATVRHYTVRYKDAAGVSPSQAASCRRAVGWAAAS